MANGEYGKIFKRVWGDEDFKALNARQQLLYLKLLSQPDISIAGVLTMAVPRWAAQTVKLTVKEVEADLRALEKTSFVVCDHETQEVLVRSYIRNDLGWKSTKTFKSIAGAVERVLSPSIRGAISSELTKIDTKSISDKQGSFDQTPREYVEQVISRLISENPPRDTPSHGVSDGVSDGVFGPRRNTPAPANTPANANAPTNPLIVKGEGAGDRFTEFWTAFPSERKANKSGCRDKFTAAVKAGTDPQTIIEAAQRYRDDPNREAQYTVNPHKWLREERWESGPLPARFTAQRPSDLAFEADMRAAAAADQSRLQIEGGGL